MALEEDCSYAVPVGNNNIKKKSNSLKY